MELDSTHNATKTTSIPPSDVHFADAQRTEACDHCTYFKGIVYRVAVHQDIKGDERLVMRSNNMRTGPQSLESVALKEEAVERREHAEYMAWGQRKDDISKLHSQVLHPRNVNQSTKNNQVAGPNSIHVTEIHSPFPFVRPRDSESNLHYKAIKQRVQGHESPKPAQAA